MTRVGIMVGIAVGVVIAGLHLATGCIPPKKTRSPPPRDPASELMKSYGYLATNTSSGQSHERHGRLAKAAWSYKAAAQYADETEGKWQSLKRSGKVPATFQKLSGRPGDTWTAAELERELELVATTARTRWAELEPRLPTIWADEYWARTPQARDEMRRRGEPTEVEVKGQTMCWRYIKAHEIDELCWTKRGELAGHTKQARQRAGARPVAAGGRPAAGGGAAPAGLDDAAVRAAIRFGSGDCRFADCKQFGWMVRGPTGTHEVLCSFDRCLQHGWTARHPDGRQSVATCNFNDCRKHGWIVKLADGRSLECTCTHAGCGLDVECR